MSDKTLFIEELKIKYKYKGSIYMVRDFKGSQGGAPTKATWADDEEEDVIVETENGWIFKVSKGSMNIVKKGR